MKPISRRIYALTSIALAVVLFVSVNMVANFWLRAARIDLTQNGLFSVSAGTKQTLAKLQEPITLRFYYSRQPAQAYAQIVSYSNRVRDLLQEYSALAGGKLIVEEIDPAPFTPGEVWSSGLTSLDEAKRLGFIGICDTTDNRLPTCEAWMKENAPNAEQLVMTTQRFFAGHPGPSTAWKIFIQPPAK